MLHLYHLPITLAEDTTYPDTCNYDYTGYMCGNSCTQQTVLCSCGEISLDYHSSQYCCTAPGDLCSKEDPSDYFSDTVCPTGRPVDKSSPCHGVCYNDYHRSARLGPAAHVSCGGGDTCLGVEHMCSGLQCAEAAAECGAGERLRCREVFSSSHRIGHDADIRNITSTILAGHHFYCDYNSARNTRTFENIDRSDETQIENFIIRSKAVKDYNLKACSSEGFFNHTGLVCEDECKSNFAWCRDDYFQFTCSNVRNNATSTVQSTDPLLCGDRLFWRDVDCGAVGDDGGVARFGRHCQGTAQQERVYLSIYLSQGGLTSLTYLNLSKLISSTNSFS